MKKLFISADIEGTCGIASWKETEKNNPDYARFAKRMTMEVAAACLGALEGGMEQVIVRDAHDSAMNIDSALLPKEAQLIRGWGRDPLCMMSGLDGSFHGAVLTGYHDAAGTGSNPLSHTMTTSLVWLTLNGELLSEGVISAYTAAYCKVPVLAVSGDAGICARMKALIPGCAAVALNKGDGNRVTSVHPETALGMIREMVKQACLADREQFMLDLPEKFALEVRYMRHDKAYSAGFYPGVQRLDSHTLRYESADWYEVLRMMHFCL